MGAVIEEIKKAESEADKVLEGARQKASEIVSDAKASQRTCLKKRKGSFLPAQLS